jgi:hypothetical protein
MTVLSYKDNLDFGIYACPDLVDDPFVIADALETALADLQQAAAKANNVASKSSGSKTAAAS